MKRTRRIAFIVLGLVLLATAPAAAESCQLNRVASLDMSIDSDGHVAVPMTVGGQTYSMLIDTGAISSMLTQSTVDQLGLWPQVFTNADIRMFGGQKITRFVVAKDVSLGALKARTMFFLVLPDSRAGLDFQGMLAPDVMSLYDDDFDFANAKFNLFQQSACEGSLVYWTKDPYSKIPFEFDSVDQIQFTVNLDGQEVQATLDTGAADTVLDLDLAERLFGFDAKDPRLAVQDSGLKSGHAYKYPFKTLTFGGVTVSNPDIVLVPHADTHMDSRILIGIGILRQLHMYISYRQRELFVTAASAH
jgi:predicted aspartyl protease